MPKISVIIPVYNVEQYLRQCLDSVVNQTLKDIEIILVDDGSTDSSLSICNEYAQKDSRIKVLKQNHKGAGAARNKGIKNSKSEFVIFLDADDYYPETDILETLYNNAKEHKVHICGGCFSYLCDGKITNKHENTFDGYTFNENALWKYVDYQFDYGYHRFIYNLKFLKDNKIYFPDYKRFQDPPFLVKAMYKAKKFYAITKTTYLLRCGHKTINWTQDKKAGLLDGIKDNLNFAKKYKLEKLYYLTCERLNQHAYAFENKKDSMTPAIFLRILNIVYRLDWEIIKKYNPDYELNENYKIFKDFCQTIFSIKNSWDRRHKIITVLGLRIKIRRKER